MCPSSGPFYLIQPIRIAENWRKASKRLSKRPWNLLDLERNFDSLSDLLLKDPIKG